MSYFPYCRSFDRPTAISRRRRRTSAAHRPPRFQGCASQYQVRYNNRLYNGLYAFAGRLHNQLFCKRCKIPDSSDSHFSMTKKKVKPDMYALSTLIFVSVLVLMILMNVLQARSEKKERKRAKGSEGWERNVKNEKDNFCCINIDLACGNTYAFGLLA